MNIRQELLKIANGFSDNKIVDLRNVWKPFVRKLRNNEFTPKDVAEFQKGIREKLTQQEILDSIDVLGINSWKQMIENICDIDVQDYDTKSFDEYWNELNNIANDNNIFFQTY